MTASEPPGPLASPRSVERAVELFVYLPAGLITSAMRTSPSFVASQRAKLSQQLENAHVVGRFAVGIGWRQLRSRLERSTRTIERMDDARDERRPPEPSTPRLSLVERGSPAIPGVEEPDADEQRAAAVKVDAVIPDYDTLAASQVVRRLDGLAPQELRAVAKHEVGARHRRTILHRIDQLITDPGSREPR